MEAVEELSEWLLLKEQIGLWIFLGVISLMILMILAAAAWNLIDKIRYKNYLKWKKKNESKFH